MGENMDQIRVLEEEEDEALSLCDLALEDEACEGEYVEKTEKEAPLSPQSNEFFSFLSDLSIDMCPADDIIFCGKLVSSRDPNVSVQPQKSGASSKHDKIVHKRSESLSELQSAAMRRSDSMKSAKVLRNSRSLDHKNLSRLSSSTSSSPDPSIQRKSSWRSFGNGDSKKGVKPRWYVLMFGSVKLPPEMELKDIKNRQLRRNPSAMFPSMDDKKKIPAQRSSGKAAGWRILKALSCRNPTSIETTTPFGVPLARA